MVKPSRCHLKEIDELALNIAVLRRKWVENKAAYLKKIDAEKTKLCSDGQIFPRGGSFRIADAQAN